MKEKHRSTEFSSAVTVLLYIPNIIGRNHSRKEIDQRL